jgi:hypothetical protein
VQVNIESTVCQKVTKRTHIDPRLREDDEKNREDDKKREDNENKVLFDHRGGDLGVTHLVKADILAGGYTQV